MPLARAQMVLKPCHITGKRSSLSSSLCEGNWQYEAASYSLPSTVHLASYGYLLEDTELQSLGWTPSCSRGQEL